MASSQTQRQTNRREATMAVPRIGCFRLSPARGTQGGGTKLQVVKEGSFWFILFKVYTLFFKPNATVDFTECGTNVTFMTGKPKKFL